MWTIYATIKMWFGIRAYWLVRVHLNIWTGFVLYCANCCDFYRWNGHQAYQRHVLNVIYHENVIILKRYFVCQTNFPLYISFQHEKKEDFARSRIHTHMRATYVSDNQWSSSLSLSKSRQKMNIYFKNNIPYAYVQCTKGSISIWILN